MSDQNWVNETLEGMSLERRIAQLITVEISGAYVPEDSPQLEGWRGLARDLGVGGLVLYGGTPRDVASLLNRLQSVAAVPLLISADFEGGPGQQVRGASEFPANMALSAAGDEELTYRVGRIGGTEGRAMGIHLTYTPVADITGDPDNPAESVRTFGADLALLGRMIRAYVRGYREAGMLNTAKHFPGRGDVRAMKDWPGFTFLDKSAERIENGELRAFRHAIEAGVSFVMTEHVAAPHLTGGSDLPASVEPLLATHWLREKLGFRGILTSDDLWYDVVCDRFGAEDVAVKAIQAGHDVLLKPRDPAAVVARVARAVRNGEIPVARIDESVRKVLAVKASLGLHRCRTVDEAAVTARVGTREHLATVREVADRSLTLLRNDGVLPLPPAALERVVNLSFQKIDNDPSPPELAARLAAVFPGTRSFTIRADTSAAAVETAARAAADATLVVVSLFVPRDRLGDRSPLRPGDVDLIRRVVTASRAPVVAMSYGNPYHIEKLGEIPAYAVGWAEKGWFGNQVVYFESFAGMLRGEVKPAGRLPVTVNERYPLGAGIRL